MLPAPGTLETTALAAAWAAGWIGPAVFEICAMTLTAVPAASGAAAALSSAAEAAAAASA
jgi:hypothetical protein